MRSTSALAMAFVCALGVQRVSGQIIDKGALVQPVGVSHHSQSVVQTAPQPLSAQPEFVPPPRQFTPPGNVPLADPLKPGPCHMCGVSPEADGRCCCGTSGPDPLCSPLDHSDGSRTHIGGWIQLGYHDKATPRSLARGDLAAFNDVPRTVNIHQFWLYVESRAQRSKDSWDSGYRMDFVYGTDAQKTQAFGNPPDSSGRQSGWDNDWDNGVYGWAIPQLYLELANEDCSVVAGHFFSLVGYEAVIAPENFFYSRALTTFNSEPLTHTGVLVTRTLSDCLGVYAGWTFGWDTGFDQFRGSNSFLGGLSLALGDAVSINYIFTSGDFGARGFDAYAHSLVFDVRLTDRLQYVLQNDVVAIGASAAARFDDQVGMNQYLMYHSSDCVAFGGRLEWWKTDGTSFHELTLGVNYRPYTDVVIRPEIRYDWQGNLNRLGVIGRDQTTFGIDALLTF